MKNQIPQDLIQKFREKYGSQIDNVHRKYTPDEDKLVLTPGMSNKEKAKILGRTISSVQGRNHMLKNPNHQAEMRAYRLKYYQEHKEAIRARNKAYTSQPRVKARIYLRGEVSRRNNLDKYNARRKVNYRIITGEMKRLPCAVCGDIKSQAHHEDYNKPLDVIFLCRIHHIEADNKRRLIINSKEGDK